MLKLFNKDSLFLIMENDKNLFSTNNIEIIDDLDYFHWLPTSKNLYQEINQSKTHFNRTIFVDIDNTLLINQDKSDDLIKIFWKGRFETSGLNSSLLNYLMSQKNVNLVLWSTQGKEYAKTVNQVFPLNFKYTLDKPISYFGSMENLPKIKFII